MKYLSFLIQNYRAIKELKIDLGNKLIPLVGINECGKTTILQAIYAFDCSNDKEYEGRHIKSTLNLYDTAEHEAVITAEIQLTRSDLLGVLESISIETLTYRQNEEKFVFNKADATKRLPPNMRDLKLEISRNLNTKAYSTNWNPNGILNSETINNAFCKKVISYMPYILYNDDFSDRPPSEIKIPVKRPDTLTGWLDIYERLFKTTDTKYSLFSIIAETDQRRKASILSDVGSTLNSTLSEAWRTFSSDKTKNVNVLLEINGVTEQVLKISIVEKLVNKNRYFDILDRSKGFIWHFNFIMKTQFNPKIMGKVEDTIFLLDEPGSYLHSLAQEKLCSKLAEISKSFGNVIYCTHSHNLLNPKFIPLRNILIVEKNTKKIISTTPLPVYKTKMEKISALQPVYEALQIPTYEIFSDDSVIVLVEGIYDKYAIEVFTNVPANYKISPCTSADAVTKNIQYMLTYNKTFKALWDNDEEGRKNKNRATKDFDLDDKNLKLLPLENRDKRRMEDMFTKKDFQTMIELLRMPENATYETIVSSLYFSSSKIKQDVLKKISDETKSSFQIMEKILYE